MTGSGIQWERQQAEMLARYAPITRRNDGPDTLAGIAAVIERYIATGATSAEDREAAAAFLGRLRARFKH